MCVDATDPMKGNWLRYVNWAGSSEEQNLFPLEINRAIYYKVLRVRHTCTMAGSFQKLPLSPHLMEELNTTTKVTNETSNNISETL